MKLLRQYYKFCMLYNLQVPWFYYSKTMHSKFLIFLYFENPTHQVHILNKFHVLQEKFCCEMTLIHGLEVQLNRKIKIGFESHFTRRKSSIHKRGLVSPREKENNTNDSIHEHKTRVLYFWYSFF